MINKKKRLLKMRYFIVHPPYKYKHNDNSSDNKYILFTWKKLNTLNYI